jgi:hypothetical protein
MPVQTISNPESYGKPREVLAKEILANEQVSAAVNFGLSMYGNLIKGELKSQPDADQRNIDLALQPLQMVQKGINLAKRLPKIYDQGRERRYGKMGEVLLGTEPRPGQKSSQLRIKCNYFDGNNVSTGSRGMREDPARGVLQRERTHSIEITAVNCRRDPDSGLLHNTREQGLEIMLNEGGQVLGFRGVVVEGTPHRTDEFILSTAQEMALQEMSFDRDTMENIHAITE